MVSKMFPIYTSKKQYISDTLDKAIDKALNRRELDAALYLIHVRMDQSNSIEVEFNKKFEEDFNTRNKRRHK